VRVCVWRRQSPTVAGPSAAEGGVSFIAGGHYNTERLGVLALGDVIREQFDVKLEFVDLPNEV